MTTINDKVQHSLEVKKYIISMVEHADETDYRFLLQVSTLIKMHFEKKRRH